jgi:hypothetical protein
MYYIKQCHCLALYCHSVSNKTLLIVFKLVVGGFTENRIVAEAERRKIDNLSDVCTFI